MILKPQVAHSLSWLLVGRSQSGAHLQGLAWETHFPKVRQALLSCRVAAGEHGGKQVREACLLLPSVLLIGEEVEPPPHLSSVLVRRHMEAEGSFPAGAKAVVFVPLVRAESRVAGAPWVCSALWRGSQRVALLWPEGTSLPQLLGGCTARAACGYLC